MQSPMALDYNDPITFLLNPRRVNLLLFLGLAYCKEACSCPITSRKAAHHFLPNVMPLATRKTLDDPHTEASLPLMVLNVLPATIGLVIMGNGLNLLGRNWLK